MSRRFCFTLDLKDEPAQIAEDGKYQEKNPKMQDGAQLRWRFQQALPEAKPGEQWPSMKRIFEPEPERARHIKLALRGVKTL
jgi:hypothetical protein